MMLTAPSRLSPNARIFPVWLEAEVVDGEARCAVAVEEALHHEEHTEAAMGEDSEVALAAHEAVPVVAAAFEVAVAVMPLIEKNQRYLRTHHDRPARHATPPSEGSPNGLRVHNGIFGTKLVHIILGSLLGYGHYQRRRGDGNGRLWEPTF
jgi:hypothetical protein